MEILFVHWDFNPAVVSGWNMPRWYGIMWALSFYLGYKILDRIYKFEKVPEKWMDKTFIYVLIGGIVGARLGHCLFYDPNYYLKNPVEILYVWEGGLASHGGALGIILAAFLLSKIVMKNSILWVLDRLVVPTAMAGGLIRLGNLFNHEIVGNVTTSPLGFKFLRNEIGANQAMNITGKMTPDEAYSTIASNPTYAWVWEQIPARYPAQLYEAICYFIFFGIILYLYWRTNAGEIRGFLLGVFFILIFGARFFIEYIKENQEGIDQSLTGLNMGQYLSIPLVLFGLFLVGRKIKEFKRGRVSN